MAGGKHGLQVTTGLLCLLIIAVIIYSILNSNKTSPMPTPTNTPAESIQKTSNPTMVPSVSQTITQTFNSQQAVKSNSPSFTISQSDVYPGDTITIFVSGTNKKAFTVKAPFYDKTIKFYPYKDGYVGIIPVYAWLSPDTYQIKAYADGTKLIKTFDIVVSPKKFDVQHLKVDQSTSAILSDDNAAKDQVYFDKARSNPIQKKMWAGAFIQPVAGEISTDYCSTRYTNDNPNPSRHLAIDIANSEGTPIKASNNGKVVLARKLITTGYSVVIDHGMGIFTSSFHLSKLLVKEGDVVTKGAIIGEMGSTGYSTGPHLHFAIWMDGTFVNPWTFFSKDPLDF